MPKKGELPPWLRKRKAKLGRKFKVGTKDKKFAAARDAAAAAAAKDVQAARATPQFDRPVRSSTRVRGALQSIRKI